MYTDKNLDTGDIISQSKIDIDINDTYDIVSNKLSVLGANLLKETLKVVYLLFFLLNINKLLSFFTTLENGSVDTFGPLIMFSILGIKEPDIV